MASANILLFDGVCNLCNASVQFVLRNDRRHRIVMASLQGKFGQAWLQQKGLPTSSFHTLIFIEGDQYFTEMEAVIKVLTCIGGYTRTVWLLQQVPKTWNRGIYQFISRNRYRLFGKRKSCRIPRQKELARFIQ